MNTTTGFIEGIPIPYSSQTDDIIAFVLLACFLMSAYILGRSGKLLLQEGKDFILNKERNNLFVVSTAADMRNQLLLTSQLCVLAGIYFVCYFELSDPGLFNSIPSHVILLAYILFSSVYIILKWVLYSSIGWVFFENGRTKFWMDSYSVLLYHLSLVSFPLVLILVCLDLNINIVVIVGGVVLIITKILLLFKCLKVFLNKTDGLFLIILYFCALEIVPCFVCYKALLQINNVLLIKF